MRRDFLFCLVILIALIQPLPAAELLRPDQLQPGMTGYGLSVFRGTQPQRFEVEVVGVLPKVFPKQDMILVRMSGADLEKHKIIAGMSGSPVYIRDRLVGAIAYGWSFENEPLAGVTPIQNMLAELNRPTPPRLTSSAGPGVASTVPWQTWATNAGAPAFMPSTGNLATPRPVMTPLSLGGFSPRLIERVSQRFERWGFLPLAVGGRAASAAAVRGRDLSGVEPGAAIGVELIRGDLNAVAIGTATYVEKGRVLAFGHPFFQAGPFVAPAVLAEVHAIMSSVARSFKLASGLKEVGAMVGDWQSCIVADTSVTAPMIPLTVEVVNRGTGHQERYVMEVVDNQVFAPMLVQMAIAQSIDTASGSSQDTTVRVDLSAELPDRTVRVSNTFFHPRGGMLDPWALAPLAAVFNTPFGHPPVKRVVVQVEAVLARQTAEIKRAYFTKAEAERGESLPLHVVLKPFGEPEVVKTIPIQVPTARDFSRGLSLRVLPGSAAPADVAPPDSLDDYLEAIQKQHRSTELVVLVRSPSQGLQYRGKLLKKLPLSVLDVLDDVSTSGVSSAADIVQRTLPTDWVLSGRAAVRIPIR